MTQKLPLGGQSARAQIEEQVASNRSAVGYFDHFAAHRGRLTALTCKGVSRDAGLRLCILGAGNCHDLDLTEVATRYREVHLVDIDRAALEHARDRQPKELRERIFCHAPVDLTGVLDRIDRWAKMRVTLEELMAAPQVASGLIVEALPGPFDVVVSACLLTQLQLTVLNILTDRHRLFEAVRQSVNLIHLRALVRLMVRGGRGVFATDITSNLSYPFEKEEPSRDLRPLVSQLVRAGNIIYAANPELLSLTWREDPFLSRTAILSPPSEAWLWHNGPERIFLVYAMEILRHSGSSATGPGHDS